LSPINILCAVRQLIKKETTEHGIPSHRILLGGFSMVRFSYIYCLIAFGALFTFHSEFAV